jgi:DNA-binding NarL/FixJ family response regulator
MASDRRSPAEGDQAGPIRVLIAEDDPRVRQALCAFLAAAPGFAVVGEAGTAALALTLAYERAPAVALVDVSLPDAADGLELLRTLTEKLRLPTVAISLQAGLSEPALAAGAYRFVLKDGVAELLLAALRAAAMRQM